MKTKAKNPKNKEQQATTNDKTAPLSTHKGEKPRACCVLFFDSPSLSPCSFSLWTLKNPKRAPLHFANANLHKCKCKSNAKARCSYINQNNTKNYSHHNHLFSGEVAAADAGLPREAAGLPRELPCPDVVEGRAFFCCIIANIWSILACFSLIAASVTDMLSDSLSPGAGDPAHAEAPGRIGGPATSLATRRFRAILCAACAVKSSLAASKSAYPWKLVVPIKGSELAVYDTPPIKGSELAANEALNGSSKYAAFEDDSFKTFKAGCSSQVVPRSTIQRIVSSGADIPCSRQKA